MITAAQPDLRKILDGYPEEPRFLVEVLQDIQQVRRPRSGQLNVAVRAEFIRFQNEEVHEGADLLRDSGARLPCGHTTLPPCARTDRPRSWRGRLRMV